MLLYEFVIVGRHTTTAVSPETAVDSGVKRPRLSSVDSARRSDTSLCDGRTVHGRTRSTGTGSRVVRSGKRPHRPRGDSPDLPRGWDRLRRQIRPGRRSFFTARASSERLTTDALDWWKSFAEGRIDVTECLTDLVERATGCYLPSRATGCQPSPAAAVSHLAPVAHGLVAEYLEQQAFLVSPDWPTYLVNIWLIATRLTEPEIRRAHETATELDLSSALCRLPRADGGVVVQQHRGRRCPEASVAAARQHHCIWPQLCRLTQCILHYQADRKERLRIAAREGRPLEPTPCACTGSRGSELPPTLPLTYFEWEVRPLFYPRDAHDRSERAGVSVALIGARRSHRPFRPDHPVPAGFAAPVPETAAPTTGPTH